MSARAPAKRRRFAPSNLLTSLVLVFPLFLAYQVGVLLDPDRVANGADLITGLLLRVLHGSLGNYIALQAALTAAFLVLVLLLRTKQRLEWTIFVPVVAESALYALTMGSLILHGMGLLGVSPTLAVAAEPDLGGPLTRVALALGAGVNEELMFRLILLGGTVLLLTRGLGVRAWIATAFAFVVTSVLFSAAHHLIGGEPFRVGAFVYRIGCGLFFASLYQWRGFAVAVYTHALYDVYVMLLR